GLRVDTPSLVYWYEGFCVRLENTHPCIAKVAPPGTGHRLPLFHNGLDADRSSHGKIYTGAGDLSPDTSSGGYEGYGNGVHCSFLDSHGCNEHTRHHRVSV